MSVMNLVSSKQEAVSRNSNPAIHSRWCAAKGFTLVELIVSVGLFALVMVLASGAYLMIIGVNYRVQSTSASIDNISFAFESMARDLRSGSSYHCGSVTTSPVPTNCEYPNPGSSLSFFNKNAQAVSYSVSGSALVKTINGSTIPLTNTNAVTINSINFYVTGAPKADGLQPQIVLVVTGTTVGKIQQSFTVETGATVRGPDL